MLTATQINWFWRTNGVSVNFFLIFLKKYLFINEYWEVLRDLHCFFKDNVWRHWNLVFFGSHLVIFSIQSLPFFETSVFIVMWWQELVLISQSCMKVRICLAFSDYALWYNKCLCLKFCSVNLLQKLRVRSCGTGMYGADTYWRNNGFIKMGDLNYHSGSIVWSLSPEREYKCLQSL